MIFLTNIIKKELIMLHLAIVNNNLQDIIVISPIARWECGTIDDTAVGVYHKSKQYPFIVGIDNMISDLREMRNK